jgi:hypothetical protein
MQSHIQITGYGFHKRICEDVTHWFLDRFLPRHRLDVRIVHRGLKREFVYGWCDFEDDYIRPRSFLIELQTHMNEEMYIKTLLHELVHLRQWVMGSLQFRRGKMLYCKEPVEFYAYEDQPHEIEAREQEETLYLEYILEKNPVSVQEVAQHFPNRLLQAV